MACAKNDYKVDDYKDSGDQDNSDKDNKDGEIGPTSRIPETEAPEDDLLGYKESPGSQPRTAGMTIGVAGFGIILGAVIFFGATRFRRRRLYRLKSRASIESSLDIRCAGIDRTPADHSRTTSLRCPRGQSPACTPTAPYSTTHREICNNKITALGDKGEGRPLRT